MTHALATLFFLLAALGGAGVIVLMLQDRQYAILSALGFGQVSAPRPLVAPRVRVRRVVGQFGPVAPIAVRRAA